MRRTKGTCKTLVVFLYKVHPIEVICVPIVGWKISQIVCNQFPSHLITQGSGRGYWLGVIRKVQTLVTMWVVGWQTWRILQIEYHVATDLVHVLSWLIISILWWNIKTWNNTSQITENIRLENCWENIRNCFWFCVNSGIIGASVCMTSDTSNM